MAVARTSLADLPNEIIQQILFYIPPSSAPAIQRVSRRFNSLIQPILWRYHCRTQFKHWDQKHNIQAKFADEVAKVDWKNVFSSRHSVDRATSHAIDAILSCQVGRVEKFQSIVRCGYDAKDTLLRHLNVDDDAEDVLARRYAIIMKCTTRVPKSADVVGTDITATSFLAACIEPWQLRNGRSSRTGTQYPSRGHLQHTTCLCCTTEMVIFKMYISIHSDRNYKTLINADDITSR